MQASGILFCMCYFFDSDTTEVYMGCFGTNTEGSSRGNCGDNSTHYIPCSQRYCSKIQVIQEILEQLMNCNPCSVQF